MGRKFPFFMAIWKLETQIVRSANRSELFSLRPQSFMLEKLPPKQLILS